MGETFRLTGEKKGDELVLTEHTSHAMRYIFSDITHVSFNMEKRDYRRRKKLKGNCVGKSFEGIKLKAFTHALSSISTA